MFTFLYCDQYLHTSDQFYQKLRLNCFKAAVFSSDSNCHALQRTRFPSYPSLGASRIISTTIIDSWISGRTIYATPIPDLSSFSSHYQRFLLGNQWCNDRRNCKHWSKKTVGNKFWRARFV